MKLSHEWGPLLKYGTLWAHGPYEAIDFQRDVFGKSVGYNLILDSLTRFVMLKDLIYWLYKPPLVRYALWEDQSQQKYQVNNYLSLRRRWHCTKLEYAHRRLFIRAGSCYGSRVVSRPPQLELLILSTNGDLHPKTATLNMRLVLHTPSQAQISTFVVCVRKEFYSGVVYLVHVHECNVTGIEVTTLGLGCWVGFWGGLINIGSLWSRSTNFKPWSAGNMRPQKNPRDVGEA